MKPLIDYKHVLSELSINRKDPCEVIRELISNSYDADAKTIFYFPIIEKNGFVFIDDGIGLDTKNEIQGITPYRAFFSIGKSIKVKGAGVGYKCQGSKLCFACTTFKMITKTKNDPQWFYKTIENPLNYLSETSDITPNTTRTPWSVLWENLQQSNQQTQSILGCLDDSFFSKFSSGTIILVLGFQTSSFATFFRYRKSRGFLPL